MHSEQLNGQLNLANIDPLQHKEFTVRKRDGRVSQFDETRIYLAIEAAFKVESGLTRDEQAPDVMQAVVQKITEKVVQECLARAVRGEVLDIERVQDTVETQLMAAGQHAIAKSYILYREERRKSRALSGARTSEGQPQAQIFVTLKDGGREPIDPQLIRRRVISACRGLEDKCSYRDIVDETLQNLYDGVRVDEVDKAMVMAAKARIEIEPAYSYVAARLLLKKIYKEVLPSFSTTAEIAGLHRKHFKDYIAEGIHNGRLSADLLKFDLE